MRRFDFKTLERQRLECEECGWAGRGYETDKGYVSLPEAIEVYCPVCGNFMGEIRNDPQREDC